MGHVKEIFYKLPRSVSAVIAGIFAFTGGFFLLFGITNLVYPDVPDSFLVQNILVCSVVILLGILCVLASVFAIIALVKR
ncbi:MAG: hypothetical protein ACPGTP_02170 [Bacteroidia bacterium]